MRNLDDTVTDHSRIETDLNSAIPGDIRETSTPDRLKFYTQILMENATGDTLIRAGVPSNIKVGAKTSAASFGMRNDIAILYPPYRKLIIIVVFSNKAKEDDHYDDNLISDTAKIMSQYFGLSY